MIRRMSVALTLDAVRSRTKTVTRRHVDTWRSLKAGDRLTLIEKGMGLPKGAKQVVVAEVEVVNVRVEPIEFIHAERHGTAKEGLGHMTGHEFISFWCESHGYKNATYDDVIDCRRIEWRYLDAP